MQVRCVAGEILKKRREELGFDINEVSETLKISSDYLFSIENDLYDKLPVAVYTVGYIRCYAKYLEVDAGPVISDFTSHLSSPKPSAIIPVSSSRRKVPGYVYVVFLLLAGVSAFAFYMYTGKNLTSSRTAEKISPPVKRENIVPAVPSAPNSEAVKKPAESNVETNNMNEPLPANMNEPLPAAPVMGGHQLEVTASDTVWMRITFENGKSEELLLEAGTSKSWTFGGTAVLKIGNAGGIALKFDGKDLGVQGDRDQVLDLTLPRG